MPPRKKGGAKASAAAAKRAGKQAAASPRREASVTDAAVNPEAAEPAAEPPVIQAEAAEDDIAEPKPQVDVSQVQPSATSDVDTVPMEEDASEPIREEVDSLTPLSQARRRLNTPPDAEDSDSNMEQSHEMQIQPQTEIKQGPTVTYPESDTEEAPGQDQNAEPISHSEERLEEIEDEAEIEANDAMDTPFSTEKIRHTSPISARVLQNVRALKEEILNGGGNKSGIGILARFTLDQVQDNADEDMPDVQEDAAVVETSVQSLVSGNAASSSKTVENPIKHVPTLDPSKRNNHSQGNFPDRATEPWPRSDARSKRDQRESSEGAQGSNSADYRLPKRPRNDSPVPDWRDRKSDQDRLPGRFASSIGSQAGPVRDNDQGARAGRRERFSDQSSQLPPRLASGNAQREERRDTARDNARSFTTDRRPTGSFQDPSRPPPPPPPASQQPRPPPPPTSQRLRDSNGPPFFPPPAQYSAAAPPPPPAFVPSAQSFGSNASLSAGSKRPQDSTFPPGSGPHSSPYPSRFNAGFDRENGSQQLPKSLPNSAPGSTERRGFQDRLPPVSGARPPVTNRARDEPDLPSSKPPLPSLTAANLGANARHDDVPARPAGRAVSRASDDGRSNISEARRLMLEGPGTAGPPGRRVPPGSAALRAELEARQQARGTPRYRYVGHIDVERGVLEIPAGVHEDLTRRQPHSRFSPDPHSAKGPSFNASSSVTGRPPVDPKPYSAPNAAIRSQDPHRPPFSGPNNSGVPPMRNGRDDDFNPRRDPPSRSGQSGPAYGGGPAGSRSMDFSPPLNSRGLINREIDRRPAIVPPVRQNYDDQIRARPPPYSGDRGIERPYSAFPHGGARHISMQEDLRLAPESYLSRHDSNRGASPPVSRFSTSSLVEQELAAMKQKIADLERLRALELSVYGGASQVAPSHRQVSPPRLDQSPRYIPMRDRVPPGDIRDQHVRDIRHVGNFQNGQDARDSRNNGNIRDTRPDIRVNGNHRNVQESRSLQDEAGYRPAHIQQTPSHGASYDDRGGPQPASGFSARDLGFRGNAPEQRNQQPIAQFDNLNRSTGTARNGPSSFMPGEHDRTAARFPSQNIAGPPRDSRRMDGHFERNQRGDFQRQDNVPSSSFNGRYAAPALDHGRAQANAIAVPNGIIPARPNGPPPRMDQQAQRGRR